MTVLGGTVTVTVTVASPGVFVGAGFGGEDGSEDGGTEGRAPAPEDGGAEAGAVDVALGALLPPLPPAGWLASMSTWKLPVIWALMAFV